MIDLEACARSLVAPGRGILAADESGKSADKRLAEYGVAGSPETHRQFRDLFLSAPGIEEYISGVILYEETLAQKNDAGVPFPKALHARGIVPGIKVDTGTEPLEDSPDELITNGLLGLPERLAAYRRAHHTGFTKWRAVVRIEGDRLPSSLALVENAKRLASYAKAVQECGMVAIVEPEVLLEGKHSRVRARAVITDTLSAVVKALQEHAVDLGGVLVKTSMALSGDESGKTDSPEEVAEDTLGALMASVPKDILGVVFLSGGQTPDQATENLRAIAREGQKKNAPWPLTFSYARALQEEALSVWAGKSENVPAAREAYLARLAKVSAASKGA